MKVTKLAAAVICGCAISVSVSAAGANSTAPTMTGASASMLANTCAGCHGTDGASVGPSIPSIAGMSEAYIKETMEEYASGDTNSTIMGRIAKGYSAEDLDAIAKHFAMQPVHKQAQDYDKALAKKGAKLHDKYCEKCHSEGGTLADDDAGQLGGQLVPYLHSALEDFHSKDRKVPKKMKKKLKKLHKKEGAAGMDALMNYYASQH